MSRALTTPVKTKFTYDYTVHDGEFKGNSYPAGSMFDTQKERDEHANGLAKLLLHHGCKVSISRRTRGYTPI